ncbi:MAG: LPS assembly lipoprotein LptE [Flavisolibacter sp.]|jgi:hypothetical protein
MKKLFLLPALFLVLLLNIFSVGCYSFRETSPLPDTVKTVNIHLLDNRAPYLNTQLAPSLTERLKQKIISQTKLRQTNNDDAHLDISGYISDYSASTVGITSVNGKSQSSANRLNVSVHIVMLNTLDNSTKEFDVSRQMDFPANKSLQEAEASLLGEMVRNLTDEIFNRIFSDW